jgi:hypothetical protein
LRKRALSSRRSAQSQAEAGPVICEISGPIEATMLRAFMGAS